MVSQERVDNMDISLKWNFRRFESWKIEFQYILIK